MNITEALTALTALRRQEQCLVEQFEAETGVRLIRPYVEIHIYSGFDIVAQEIGGEVKTETAAERNGLYAARSVELDGIKVFELFEEATATT